MVSGEVPEHPLLDAGEKAISSTSKHKSDETLHIYSTLPDGLIKPHCRAPRKRG